MHGLWMFLNEYYAFWRLFWDGARHRTWAPLKR